MRPCSRSSALLLTLVSIASACSNDRQRGSAPTSAVTPAIATPQDAAERVPVGPVVLSLPAGFAIERQENLDYGDGVSGRSILIRRNANAASMGARCQVAWTQSRDHPFPAEKRQASLLQVQPINRSPAFKMSRVEASDTDLVGRIGDSQSFIVDCDDISTAQLVASYLTVSK